jgi:bacteriocin-like protein
MKKLEKKELKEIVGGDWRIFCRRQCARAYGACAENGGTDCEFEYSDCLQGCEYP